MGQELRVDTAGVHAMATRWRSSAGDLDGVVAPTGLGLPSQASAAAVDAAHGEVAAFLARLSTRVGERASGVVTDANSYAAQEASSATTLAQQVTST